jgi:hypothetical protein
MRERRGIRWNGYATTTAMSSSVEGPFDILKSPSCPHDSLPKTRSKRDSLRSTLRTNIGRAGMTRDNDN